jgi:hypothetical protein
MSNQPMPVVTRSPTAEGRPTPQPVAPPSTAEQQKTPLARRDEVAVSRTAPDERKREEDRDEVLRESFPASDPPPMSPGSAD